MVAEDPRRVSAERQLMDQPPYGLDKSRRETVLAALLERCAERNGSLLAAHARTNHVHIVVEAEARPERVMNDLKSYAGRCLNCQGLDEPARKRWARHGSKRWSSRPSLAANRSLWSRLSNGFIPSPAAAGSQGTIGL